MPETKRYYIFRDESTMSQDDLEDEAKLVEALKGSGHTVDIGVDPKPQRV